MAETFSFSYLSLDLNTNTRGIYKTVRGCPCTPSLSPKQRTNLHKISYSQIVSSLCFRSGHELDLGHQNQETQNKPPPCLQSLHEPSHKEKRW